MKKISSRLYIFLAIFRYISLLSITSFKSLGNNFKSFTISFLPATLALNKAIIATCKIYALVVATAISGPASINICWSDSRAIVEPFTLTIARVKAPCSFAFLIAAIVSAVSPDWEITITIVFLSYKTFL